MPMKTVVCVVKGKNRRICVRSAKGLSTKKREQKESKEENPPGDGAINIRRRRKTGSALLILPEYTPHQTFQPTNLRVPITPRKKEKRR